MLVNSENQNKSNNGITINVSVDMTVIGHVICGFARVYSLHATVGSHLAVILTVITNLGHFHLIATLPTNK